MESDGICGSWELHSIAWVRLRKLLNLWKQRWEPQLIRIKQREAVLGAEEERHAQVTSAMPSKAALERVSRQLSLRYTDAKTRAKANVPLEEMTYDDKRALVEAVFGGKTDDGKRMGVYVRWSDDGKRWRYRIDGHLMDLPESEVTTTASS